MDELTLHFSKLGRQIYLADELAVHDLLVGQVQTHQIEAQVLVKTRPWCIWVGDKTQHFS